MLKRTTAADATAIRVVIVTLDNHLAGAVDRTRRQLREAFPGLVLTMHAAADWGGSEAALEQCRTDIATRFTPLPSRPSASNC